MYYERILKLVCLTFPSKVIGPIRNPVVHTGTVVRRNSVHVHVQDLREYQVHVLCSCCRQKTQGHGTLWLWSVAVEPSPCPRTVQDLAEPEPPEVEAAFVRSKFQKLY